MICLDYMNRTMLLAAMILVFIALIPYTMSVIVIHKSRKITKKAFILQSLGVVLDIFGTICMFNIRPGFSWTTHAVVSLLGLVFMAIEVVFHIKFYNKETPNWLLWYTKIDYVYWLFIFFLGGLLLR